MYDLIIAGGCIIDGTGKKRFKGDVAVKGDKIMDIGDLRENAAQRRIEAANMIICPGFVDMHSHSDVDILKYPYEHNKLRQGITTEVAGQCGLSLFPFTGKGSMFFRQAMRAYNREDLDINWTGAEEFFRKVQSGGIGVNIAPQAGHATLRMDVAGIHSGRLTEDEFTLMKRLLEEALEQGAIGLSTGLGYPPCCFADTEELIELAGIVKKYKGIFSLHMRDQGDFLLEAIKESLRIGREAEVPVCISHIKASGEKNWGKMEAALELIEKARDEGIDAICDFYPYTAAENTLIYELPQWLNEKGLQTCVEWLSDRAVRAKLEDELKDKGDRYWDGVSIGKIGKGKNQKYLGMTISEISEVLGKRHLDTVCDILVEEKLGVEVVSDIMSIDDVITVAKYPMSVIGSDAYAQDSNTDIFTGHPRNFGAFPAFIKNFVIDRGVVSLEEGIRKMTSIPAGFAKLKGRGKLEKGAFADITVLDMDKLTDRATYKKPAQYPEGIPYVVVNGKVQVDSGEVKEIPCGRILSR